MAPWQRVLPGWPLPVRGIVLFYAFLITMWVLVVAALVVYTVQVVERRRGP